MLDPRFNLSRESLEAIQIFHTIRFELLRCLVKFLSDNSFLLCRQIEIADQPGFDPVDTTQVRSIGIEGIGYGSFHFGTHP